MQTPFFYLLVCLFLFGISNVQASVQVDEIVTYLEKSAQIGFDLPAPKYSQTKSRTKILTPPVDSWKLTDEEMSSALQKLDETIKSVDTFKTLKKVRFIFLYKGGDSKITQDKDGFLNIYLNVQEDWLPFFNSSTKTKEELTVQTIPVKPSLHSIKKQFLEEYLSPKLNISVDELPTIIFWSETIENISDKINRFKLAIENTHFITDLRKSNIEVIQVDYPFNANFQTDNSLYLISNKELGEWVYSLSSNSNAEPVYLKFERDRKIKLAKNLQEKISTERIIQLNLIQKELCKDQIKNKEPDSLKIYFEKKFNTTANSSFNSKFFDYETNLNNYSYLFYSKKLNFKITEQYSINNKYQRSIIAFMIEDSNNRDYITEQFWFDEKCNHYQTEIFTIDTDFKIKLKEYLKSDGELVAEYINNPPLKIQSKSHTSLENKIVVGVLDTGIDYNHPEVQKSLFFDWENFHKNEISLLNRSILWAQSKLNYLNKPKNLYQRSQIFIWGDEEVQNEKEKIISEIESYFDQIQKLKSFGWDFHEEDALPYDFAVNKSDDPFFGLDHGTHVAGIIAENQPQIVLLPLRYPEQNSELYYPAIEYANKKNARVINISLGGRSIQTWESLHRAMVDFPNILFVVSAGNTNFQTKIQDLDIEPYYPASFDLPNIITVAAVDDKNELASFSRFGINTVEVAAPGVDILSWIPGGGKGIKSGTSMAAPYVSKIAANILLKNPLLTPVEVIKIIELHLLFVENQDIKEKIMFGGIVNEQIFKKSND